MKMRGLKLRSAPKRLQTIEIQLRKSAHAIFIYILRRPFILHVLMSQFENQLNQNALIPQAI